MFDLDVSKMMIFGIVAIAVIPPKDLPRVLRTVGQYVGKMRRMATDFQGQFMDALKEADLESVKREIEAVNAAAKVDVNFDPAHSIQKEITAAVEGPAVSAEGASAVHAVTSEVNVEVPVIAESAPVEVVAMSTELAPAEHASAEHAPAAPSHSS